MGWKRRILEMGEENRRPHLYCQHYIEQRLHLLGKAVWALELGYVMTLAA